MNVEHEEVILMPRWLDVDRVTFKYGLGDEFIDVLTTLHRLGLDSTKPVMVRGVEVAPRDVVAAVLPKPAELGDRMRGRTCAGTLVKGNGLDGAAREVAAAQFTDTRAAALLTGDQRTLDALAAELNDLRTLDDC